MHPKTFVELLSQENMKKSNEIRLPQSFTQSLLDKDKEEDNSVEPKEWTIITALDRVLAKAKDSRLSDKFWSDCRKPLDFLCQKLGMKDMQVVVLAILVEDGSEMSWHKIAEYLACSRLTIMTYTEEIDELVEKRWILRDVCHERGRRYKGFTLAKGVVTALRHNEIFVPEKIEGLSLPEFIVKVAKKLECDIEYDSDDEDTKWLLQLCKLNQQLPFCREVQKYGDDIYVQILMIVMAASYANSGNTEYEGLPTHYIDRAFPHDFCCNHVRRKLDDGTHILFKDGIIEYYCEDGVANNERLCFTMKAKTDLFAEFTTCDADTKTQRTFKELRLHSSLKEKQMFYNATEEKQIDRLADLLSQEHLSGVQDRLAEQGLRRGFACVFYGEPGTGKTETVLQLARKTGRDIIQIDISSMRDKFVGESEKNLKAVFSRYRTICRSSEVTPILFFNEADAIFGKRTTTGSNPTVEKMENAMQNILLQEMEDLTGILIATTNLTGNFDRAFERRFLYKVEFHKPDATVKSRLWTSMLGGVVSEGDAKTLAARYDFSGGQIENVARKRTIEYILSGKEATFDEIDEYCRQELLDKKGGNFRRIGFVSA